MVNASLPTAKLTRSQPSAVKPRIGFALLAALILLAAAPACAPAGTLAASLFEPVGPLAGARLIEVARLPSAPTYVTHAGDDRLFVVLRAGQIRIFANGRLLAGNFLDLGTLLRQQGEGGLLSIAFHPRYAQNGFLFVNYTDLAGDTVIARYRRSAANPNLADPASGTILLTIDQPFDNHNGGQLQFGPDGFLYIGMGDGGSGGDPDCRAQRPETLLGKLLRIDVDRTDPGLPYAIPSDNPFRGPGGQPDEAWAIGLRNPWRFSFDRTTGDLWLADVGQSEREEIDLEAADTAGGRNYGWKPMEGSLCFGTNACPVETPVCGGPELTLPVLEYSHDDGCSVTGGYVYRGEDFPTLTGRYFFGDFCTGRIWAAAPGGADFEVRLLGDSASQLVTFGQDRRGELYLGTLSGQLLRLARGEGVGTFQGSNARFALRNGPASGPVDRTFQLGSGGGRFAVAGDWNGDGRSGVAVYTRAAGRFQLQNVGGTGAGTSFSLGPAGSSWLPIAGDWDGDGSDGLGLYDPATGTFRIKESASGGAFLRTFNFGPGGSGWLPIAGDWDGDGRDGIGIYDPQTGAFRLRQTADAGPASLRFRFGRAAGGQPVAGDWNGDGRDGIGIYFTAARQFLLKNVAGQGPADADFTFGPTGGGAPLAGAW